MKLYKHRALTWDFTVCYNSKVDLPAALEDYIKPERKSMYSSSSKYCILKRYLDPVEKCNVMIS